jgi:hypothetical protein
LVLLSNAISLAQTLRRATTEFFEARQALALELARVAEAVREFTAMQHIRTLALALALAHSSSSKHSQTRTPAFAHADAPSHARHCSRIRAQYNMQALLREPFKATLDDSNSSALGRTPASLEAPQARTHTGEHRRVVP